MADRRASIKLFEEAIQLHPDNAAAYAHLAIAWHLLRAGQAASAKDAYKPARDAALTALRLDPDLAEGHIAMAGVMWFEEWDWTGADREYRRARDLNPDSMELCFCYGYFLYTTGRFPEAIELTKRGITVDSQNPTAYNMHGRALYAAGRYQEALPVLERAVSLNERNVGARTHLPGPINKRFEDAVKIVDVSICVRPHNWVVRALVPAIAQKRCSISEDSSRIARESGKLLRVGRRVLCAWRERHGLQIPDQGVR